MRIQIPKTGSQKDKCSNIRLVIRFIQKIGLFTKLSFQLAIGSQNFPAGKPSDQPVASCSLCVTSCSLCCFKYSIVRLFDFSDYVLSRDQIRKL